MNELNQILQEIILLRQDIRILTHKRRQRIMKQEAKTLRSLSIESQSDITSESVLSLSIGAFLSEQTDLLANGRTSTKDLYLAYLVYMEKVHPNIVPQTFVSLTKSIIKRLPEVTYKKSNGKSYIQGLILKECSHET